MAMPTRRVAQAEEKALPLRRKKSFDAYANSCLGSKFFFFLDISSFLFVFFLP